MLEKFKLFDKTWKINLLLFSCSFGIYFYYFHNLFLNPNTILSSIDGDSLKNYYTFIYHIKNDVSSLTFSGLNFPFGEHIVYTDCQPLLGFVFRLMPFTHDYLIGILHYLILSSFVMTPLIINRIFILLTVDKFSSFFASLAITLLSPQIWRLDGHFALTYEFVIPLAILLNLNYFVSQSKKNTSSLIFLNSILFFIHPYLGFGVSIFSFVSILIYHLVYFKKTNVLKYFVNLISIRLLPIILFKIFMILTDTHINRSEQPYGIDIEIASVASVFVPNGGPFQLFLQHLITATPGQFEGLSYVGISIIFLSLILLITLPLLLKRWFLNTPLLILFFSSVLLLLFSFGLHNNLLNSFSIKINQLNQFRALGRFAWYFYYMLPIFVIPSLYYFAKYYFNEKKLRFIFSILSVLFFTLNLSEAHSTLRITSNNYWRNRNIFNEDCLNNEEKKLIKKIKKEQPQAIVPIPLYHIGSEMYDRIGSTFGILPSMLYSYHTKVPILSTMLSRTSIDETEQLIEGLNSYKTDREIIKFLNEQPFLVIKAQVPSMPDEDRLTSEMNFFKSNDSLSFGFISKTDFLKRKLILDSNLLIINKPITNLRNINNVVYIPWEARRPFTEGNIDLYETVATLDSNQVKSGGYTVSIHYHYTHKTFKEVFCNMIITERHGETYDWKYSIPIRIFSGFYDGFSVFEYKIDIAKENKYEFILKGSLNQTYKVSNFMLRPENKSVMVITKNNDTIINNFPKN